MPDRFIDVAFTALKEIEELAYPSATILPNFPRSIQLDGYSCGAKSVYTVLKYFGKRCTSRSVERQLKTDEDGTWNKDVYRVLKEHGLHHKLHTQPTLWDLYRAIKRGSPVIVALYENTHFSVVYGFDDKHIFVMDPLIESVADLFCAVPKSKFREIWDRWGVVVYK